MSNYRRPHVAGGTYFITQVTYQRQPWLCSELARTALRAAIESVRLQYPFSIDAFVLLSSLIKDGGVNWIEDEEIE
jgi:putative transposase